MIDLMQKLLAFAVTLGVLITFHELGHYFVARLAGVKVLRFSNAASASSISPACAPRPWRGCPPNR